MPERGPAGLADETIETVRRAVAALAEVVEEPAWTGTRWRVRGRTFAHVLVVTDGWPPAYARAAATSGPAVVLMIRSRGVELDVLRAMGSPFFAPPWRADEVGRVMDAPIDADEVRELVVESYLTMAPAALRRAVERPEEG